MSPTTPTSLLKTLKSSPRAMLVWQSLTPIARRDWISWINSAKQPETRQRRIEQVSSKLLSGKRRPCCYALVPMSFYQALNQNPKAKTQWHGLSPNERRDFIDWVDSAKTTTLHETRIQKACQKLAAGKQHP